MDHDAFFLAPAEPVVDGPKFDDEPVVSQDGGGINSLDEYDGQYDGYDSKEGKSDKEPEPPKPKKKKPKSMISLDSYIKKKDKPKADLPNYDQRAKDELADDDLLFSVAGGAGGAGGFGGSLGKQKYSDDHIFEPE